MQITFTLKNLTEETLAETAAMPADTAFDRLHKWAYGDLKHAVKIQIGTCNSFGDRVRVNTARKAGKGFDTFKIEPRRGYKLATFTINA